MKYKHVKQHDITDCAAACLAMVCLYYKRETTITGLRDMMGTDLIGLSKCAEKLGFENAAVRVDREGFMSRNNGITSECSEDAGRRDEVFRGRCISKGKKVLSKEKHLY